MDQTKKPKLLIVSGISIFIILIIVAIIFYIIDSRKTAILHTIIAPSFANLTIDDKIYPINQDLRFEPGEYTITVQAQDFESQTQTITLSDAQTETLALYLNPNEGDAFNWYEMHDEEYSYFLSAANYLADQSAANYAKAHPVTTILPFNIVEVDPTTYAWTEYKVTGGEFDDCKSDFCIKITDTTGGNMENALQKIRDKGFNPDDYEILYEYTPVEPLN